MALKVRKLEFKLIEMTEEVYNDATEQFEIQKQGKFSYREIVRGIIMGPGPSGSASSEEVIRSVAMYGRITDALKKGEKFVLLDKEEYEYLASRLKTFPWKLAHPVVSDFIKYIETLKEVEVEEKKDTQPAE